MADDLRLGWTKLILGSIGGTIALVVGLAQYVSTSSLSVRQPFLEKQTELCLKASEQAARLATTADRAEWDKSWQEFQMLFWGPLAMVEDVGIESQVAKRMGDFRNQVLNEGKLPSTLPVTVLQAAARDLSYACRDLVADKWRTGILGLMGYQ